MQLREWSVWVLRVLLYQKWLRGFCEEECVLVMHPCDMATALAAAAAEDSKLPQLPSDAEDLLVQLHEW